MVELVSPGGSYTRAMVAAQYGADAVYLGVPFTSLRMRQNKISTFSLLKKTIQDLHALGVKAYLTMNIFARNSDIKIFERIVEQVSELEADAIIFSDPGVYVILKKYMPHQHYHLSTQANTLNYEAVKFWEQLGVSRIILARELTIKEIEEIKKKVPTIELEVFVHGAMCIAYSGRCLLGEYFAGRDGNKGECSHVCRYRFTVRNSLQQKSEIEKQNQNLPNQKIYSNFDVLEYEEDVMIIEEEKRRGKMFDVLQDQRGSYIFSSKDLCTITFLEKILPYVDGIKIEGRSKGEFYVGAVTKAYRHMRDCIVQKKQPDPDIIQLIYDIPHRPYWSGFLFNDVKKDFPDGEETPESSISYDQAGPSVGKEYFGLIEPEFIQTAAGDVAYKFIPKQVIKVGDVLSFLSPSKNGKITITGLFDQKGNPLPYVTCNTNICFVTTTFPLQGWEILYSDPVNY